MIFTTVGLGLLAIPFAAATVMKVHHVSVGANGKLAYDPEYIQAKTGDVVKFTFNPKNHTVTQSSFAQPCVSNGGFDSGFTPVAAGEKNLPVYNVLVKDHDTVWVYCRQNGHCGSGMVFAINPPVHGPKSFVEFKKRAIALNGTATTTTMAATKTEAWTQSTSTSGYSYGAAAGDNDNPSPYSPSYPVDHKITVGADGNLSYYPANITAAVGDTVTFEFHPKNHTVTQSSFDAPCQPLADTTSPSQVGFTSGFQPVAVDQRDLPTFKIKINDTKPIWGYCGQTGHCGKGMVFAINADESSPKSFGAFQALAKKINGTST